MWGAILAGVKAIAGLFDVIGMWQRRKQRQEDREDGARAQREADTKETLRQKDEQLEKATRRRPGDASKRLRDGKF